MVGSHPAVYGAFFSDIYNRDWSFWGDHVWPLVSRVVRERNPAAHTWLDLACGTGSLLQLVQMQTKQRRDRIGQQFDRLAGNETLGIQTRSHHH